MNKCCKLEFHGCCCNCENHHKLHSHPWCKELSENYVCLIDDGDESCPHITISGEHGICEMYRKKETK